MICVHSRKAEFVVRGRVGYLHVTAHPRRKRASGALCRCHDAVPCIMLTYLCLNRGRVVRTSTRPGHSNFPLSKLSNGTPQSVLGEKTNSYDHNDTKTNRGIEEIAGSKETKCVQIVQWLEPENKNRIYWNREHCD